MSSERALAALVSRLPIRGREWLADRLFARSTVAHEWWIVDVGQGLRLRLPASSRQSWMAAFTGAYDRQQVALLAAYLRPGSIGLDIGASLGLYTVQLADRARTVGARVIAVEPIPANAEIIRDNLRRNGLSGHASVVETALGVKAGWVTMAVERGGSGNATVSTGITDREMVQHSSDGGLGPAVRIAVQPLDELRCEEPVSVVKIDAEGFEMDILTGGSAFIARHRPVIFAEFSEPWMRSRGRSPEEPFEWSRSNGYSVHKVTIERSGKALKRTSLRISEIGSARDRRAAELLLIPRS